MKPPLDLGPIKDRMVRATCVQDMNSVTLAALDIPALVAEVESMRAENERMRRVVEAAKVLRNDPHVWDEENGSYIQCVEPFSCDLCKAFDAALSPSPASEPRP